MHFLLKHLCNGVSIQHQSINNIIVMIEQDIQQAVANALKSLYNLDITPESVVLQDTKKEFVGDFTVVVFPYVKQARKSPEQLANELGSAVKEAVADVSDFNVIKGFLNFSVADSYWLQFVTERVGDAHYGIKQPNPYSEQRCSYGHETDSDSCSDGADDMGRNRAASV